MGKCRMLDPRQLSSESEMLVFDLRNHRNGRVGSELWRSSSPTPEICSICHGDVQVLIGALLWRLPNPMLTLGLPGCSSSAHHAVSCPLSHRSPACRLPLVKPRELLAGEKLLGKSADCCGKIPAGLGSRGICYFFLFFFLLLWFPFPSKGKNWGLSRCRGSLGWSFA